MSREKNGKTLLQSPFTRVFFSLTSVNLFCDVSDSLPGRHGREFGCLSTPNRLTTRGIRTTAPHLLATMAGRQRQHKCELARQKKDHWHLYTNKKSSRNLPGCWRCPRSHLSGDARHDIVELDILRFILSPVFPPSRGQCLLQIRPIRACTA